MMGKVVLIVVSVFLFTVLFSGFVSAQTCMTVDEVATERSNCLYIYNGDVYRKGNYPNEHKGNPCGTDITNVIRSSHPNNPGRYLTPYYLAPLCQNECSPSSTQGCSTGQAGVCSAGTQTCDSQGFWGSCIADVSPSTEICNGLDDDCDGSTDEGDVCSAGCALGEKTYTLSPTDDAMVYQNSPSTNYGSATVLDADIGPDKESYLKFDIPVDGPTVSAVLQMKVTSSGNSNYGGDISLSPNEQWSESSVTWNTKPAVGIQTVTHSAGVSSNEVVEWDVMNLIADDGISSLALTSTSSDGVHYLSKESGADGPKLIVTKKHYFGTGSTEVCDGTDNDCDWEVDEGNVCGVGSGADTNGDGCVSIQEIVAYVELWQQGQISIQDVVVGVERWQQGCNP